MKILYSDTPTFLFDEEKMEISDHGLACRIHARMLQTIDPFAFLSNLKDEYDVIVLLYNRDTNLLWFLACPLVGGGHGLMARYWTYKKTL